jgi:predicted RNase H-like HicB family nuclease
VFYRPTLDDHYEVIVPSYPEIVTFGSPTLTRARQMAKDALRCHLEGEIKDGRPLIVNAGPELLENISVTISKRRLRALSDH